MTGSGRAAAAQAVAAAAVDAYPRIVAALIRITGDWTLAEDSAQEALVRALDRWPAEGVPANPGGWLMTVARNRVLDVLRRASVEQRKLRELAVLALTAATDEPAGGQIVDDRLRLIFTCCHPALAIEARVALTLRTICAVPTADIARVFLVTESTMTRRLTRAKAKIAAARIPYRVPHGPDLAERLPGVLAVLYLLFTQGYDADGEPAFADEAIRLARLLVRLMPDQPEASALLALFLLQHSRRAARRDDNGDLVPLDRQDRSRWDTDAITEGVRLLARSPSDGSPIDGSPIDGSPIDGSPGRGEGDRSRRLGPYAWQARIAASHVTAPSAEETDWRRIAECYDQLVQLQPSPVIALNRAVAHGYAYGPAVGLTLLAEARSGGGLDGYPMALAVEADLLARLGHAERAAELFRAAAARTPGDAERRALLHRAATS